MAGGRGSLSRRRARQGPAAAPPRTPINRRTRLRVLFFDGKLDRSLRAQPRHPLPGPGIGGEQRSEEHTSELQSLMRISYAVFCLKKKNTKNNTIKAISKDVKCTQQY